MIRAKRPYRTLAAMAIALATIATSLTAHGRDLPARPDPTTLPDGLRPIPSDAEQAAATKLIRETIPDTTSAQPPSVRAALARKMTELAADAKNPPATTYVLLCKARDLYGGTADVALAFDAIESLGQQFAINPLEQKLTILETAARVKGVSAEQAAADSTIALGLTEVAVTAENFPGAERALRAAGTFATQSKNAGMTDAVHARTTVVRAMSVEHERARDALQKLRQDPDDPKANLAAGKYLCFSRGEWETGLAALVKGSDGALQKVAKADSAGPKTPEAKAELADQWWSAASANPAYANAIRRRAAHWYQDALDGLGGLQHALAVRRINESEALAHRTVDLLALVSPKRDSFVGTWTLEKNVLSVKRGEWTRIQIPYTPPEEYDFRITFVSTSGGGPVMQMCPLLAGGTTWYMEFNQYRLDNRGEAIAKGSAPFIENNKSYVSVVQVRKNRISAYVNDRLVCDFDRTGKDIGYMEGWRLRNDRLLALGVWASDVVFSKIELVEITGTGAPLK